MIELLLSNFKILLTQLSHLTAHLQHDIPANRYWQSEESESQLGSAKDNLILVINNLDTVNGSAQETFACLGAIGGTPLTLELVTLCNNAKDEFKNTAIQYMESCKTTDTKIIRQCLQQAGYPQTKLKHVYRHIRSIDFHPRRIAFTKVKHNSHRIITQKTAADMLFSLDGGTHIAIQQALLNQLPPHEKLVIHRDVKPVWAANISTFKNEENVSNHQRLLTSLPIIYCFNPELPPTLLELTKPHANKKSKVRSDKKIEENPFLSSISAYRYKTQPA